MSVAPFPSLDAPWCLGTEAYAGLLSHLRRIDARVIVEFGSGASTVCLSRDLPGARIVSIDDDARFFQRTRDHLPEGAQVELSHRPLAWQRHGGARYLSYAEGPMPDQVCAVIIDGPPHWTRRGREACLYQVAPWLREGGLVFLDDYARPAEQRMVQNWLRAYPGAMVEREPIAANDRVAVVEKVGPTPVPQLDPRRRSDALLQAALQPLTARIWRLSMALRGGSAE